MAFSDLFGTSFLFSIAIILPFILIGALYTYLNYKMSEQDHKLSSMVNLVSILAQEVQHVKQTNYSETTNTKTEPKEFNLEYEQTQLTLLAFQMKVMRILMMMFHLMKNILMMKMETMTMTMKM